MTFDTDLLDLAQAHFTDFLQAAGFEIPLDKNEEPDFERRITVDDWLAKAEDMMWDDAIDSKFRNDGPVGSTGADVLQFPKKK